MKAKWKPFWSAPVPGRSNVNMPGNHAKPQTFCGSDAAAPGEGRSPSDSEKRRHTRGFLEVDMLVGLAILSLAVLPLGYSFVRERQMLKVEYCRSVAMEIVDGEMEILAAGAGRDLPDGSQNYSVHAGAAASLPPGHFQLTKNGSHLRLEWNADRKQGIGAIAREVTLK
jgi:hypothetical protein